MKRLCKFCALSAAIRLLNFARDRYFILRFNNTTSRAALNFAFSLSAPTFRGSISLRLPSAALTHQLLLLVGSLDPWLLMITTADIGTRTLDSWNQDHDAG